MLEAQEIQMQLQCAPEFEFSRSAVFGPDKEIEFLTVTFQQATGNMRTKVTGGSGDEYCHDG